MEISVQNVQSLPDLHRTLLHLLIVFLYFQTALDSALVEYVSSDSPLVLLLPQSSLLMGLNCRLLVGVSILYGCVGFGWVVAILHKSLVC